MYKKEQRQIMNKSTPGISQGFSTKQAQMPAEIIK